jgi:hypothetical protein
MQMFDWFTRGWRMARSSWAVLKSHPSLTVFPVISGLALVAVTALLSVPVLFGAAVGASMQLSDQAMKTYGYVALFVWYFVCTFIIVFCNAALISAALQAFSGQQASVGYGMAAAGRRSPQILGWSFVAATVGVLLRGLQSIATDKLGFIGDLAAAIAEGVWSVATYFAVPVVVVEGVGPINAVKRSSSILRRTWGESLAGSAGLGFINFLFLLPAFGLLALVVTGVGGDTLRWTFAAILVLYALAATAIFAALNTIFRAAVYNYAITGAAPNQMDSALLQSTFRRR